MKKEEMESMLIAANNTQNSPVNIVSVKKVSQFHSATTGPKNSDYTHLDRIYGL
jgi:hypothetical protein